MMIPEITIADFPVELDAAALRGEAHFLALSSTMERMALAEEMALTPDSASWELM